MNHTSMLKAVRHLSALCLATLFALPACDKKEPAEQAAPAAEAPPAQEPAAAATTVPPAVAAAIDPSKIPTEEDYEEEAEKTVSLANLDAELDAIEKEIDSQQ